MRLAALLTLAMLAACGSPAEKSTVPVADEVMTPPPAAAPAAAPAMPVDQTTAEQKAAAEQAAAAAGLPPTKQTRTTFRCDNDETIEVRFFPDQGIAVLVRGGQNVELNGEPVASGFRFSNGQTSIEGRGNEITMTVGMMAPTKCVAA
jgi:membrane-bound inhibitor of C-type lysozyme